MSLGVSLMSELVQRTTTRTHSYSNRIQDPRNFEEALSLGFLLIFLGLFLLVTPSIRT